LFHTRGPAAADREENDATGTDAVNADLPIVWSTFDNTGCNLTGGSRQWHRDERHTRVSQSLVGLCDWQSVADRLRLWPLKMANPLWLQFGTV